MSQAAPSSPDHDLVLQHLPPEFAELLQQIPACPELSEEAAQDRLFPSPGEADGGHFAEEWKGLIEPDLQNQFLADRLTVATDLTRMKENPQGWTLTIPVGHVEAWISALNQVRLAIAAAHHLGEEEMAMEELPEKNPSLAQVLRRVHFYGLILEMLVQVAEKGAAMNAVASGGIQPLAPSEEEEISDEEIEAWIDSMDEMEALEEDESPEDGDYGDDYDEDEDDEEDDDGEQEDFLR